MTCTHRWKVATPQGPVSKAVCKHCGAVKEFQNAYLGDLPIPIYTRRVHTAKLRAE